jgi:hypothetical protein
MTRMAHRASRVLLPALLLAGCQPGTEGPLDPVPATGVVRDEDQQGRPVAVVRAGSFVARVSGTWATMSTQSVTIAYRNATATPATVPIGTAAFRRGADRLALTYANDLTDMDVNSTDPARYMPRVLVGGDGPEVGSVTVAPGETRTLTFSFAPYPEERPLASDDRITVDVPSAGKPMRVVFECSSGSFWPF